MGNRRKSREYALQLLYAREVTSWKIEDISPLFWKDRSVSPQTREYADSIVSGVIKHAVSIDTSIEQSSRNWKIVINEAIEVAKRYGDGESGQFVNGVLDAIRKSLPIRNVKE